MTVLKKLVGGQRTVQATTWGTWPGDMPAGAWSGVSLDSAQSVQQLLTVYGCNRFICDGIATLPVDALRDTPAGTLEVTKPGWLIQPTIDLDFIAWVTQVLTSLLLDGNAYCWIRRSPLAQIEELVPLNPAKVKVTREQGTRVYRIGGQPIDRYDLLHIPAVMFPGAEIGLSPIEAARQTVGKGMATEEFAARFFGQGLNMSGVIETQDDITDESARAMANTFARRHSGKTKSHLPAVLTRGAKWTATGVTNEQAQFLQTQQFTAAQICAFLFLIDPTEFGVSMDKGSSVTYANLEQRNARKVQVTFLPWIIRIENALSSLIRQSNRYVKFNVNGLLRADLSSRYESYKTGIEAGFLLPNEARDFEDLPALDGGDSFPAPATPPAPTTNSAPVIHNHVQPAQAPVVNNRFEMPPTPAATVHNHVSPPVVNNRFDVPVPEVHVDAPIVTVEAPAVTVAAAEIPAPVVSVLPAPERSKRLEYNELGDIVRVVVEEGD